MDPRLVDNSFDAKVSSVTTVNFVTLSLHPKVAEGNTFIHFDFVSSAISDGIHGGLGPES